ncbi:MAG TPA: hypothetical protein VFB77_00140, partial [Acidimicrobiales bacterium]|nr:hypothetical protein [Acidimicrobiales bacterium]
MTDPPRRRPDAALGTSTAGAGVAHRDLSRRRFLAGGLASTAAAGVGVGGLAACGGDGSGPPGAAVPAADRARSVAAYLPFRGPHQTGVTHPGNDQGLLAAF